MNPIIYDGIGQCHHITGDYELALENYSRALKLAPDNVEFLKNRA